MAVTIWLNLIECEEETGSEDCILALGDSTSAMGGFTSPKLLPDSVYYCPVQLISRWPVYHSQHPLPSQSASQGRPEQSVRPVELQGRRGSLTLSLPIIRWCPNRAFPLMHSTVDSVRFQHLAPASEVSSFLIQALQTRVPCSKQSQPREERQSVAPLDHLLRRSWSRLISSL
jgi:hypothetical protein